MISTAIERIEITPEASLPMGGFGDREGPSIGKHDPLWCTSIVFADEDIRILFLILDLIAVDSFTSSRIRREISKETKIKASHIQIVCTHTHSGPAGFRKENQEKTSTENSIHQIKAFQQYVIKKMIEVSKLAINSLSRNGVCFGSKRGAGIATNRIDPKREMDHFVSTLTLKKNNFPIGTISHFQCHPTVLNYMNRMYSSDYPHYVRKYIVNHFENPSIIPGFINGACGDVSTRHTRKGQGFKEAKRIGYLIGKHAVESIKQSNELPSRKLGFSQNLIRLKTKALPTLEEAKREYEITFSRFQKMKSDGEKTRLLRNIETEFQGARANLNLVEKGIPNSVDIEVNTISIDKDLALITVPAELFVGLGIQIKERSPFKNTLVVGYTNGIIGYIPTLNSYELKTYESRRTIFPAGTGERLVDEIINILCENS